MEDSDFLHERQQALAALASLVVEDQRIEGLWLQGSLARGDADPLSDIDAYLSVTDASFDEVFRNRFALIGSIRPILTASDATTPGLRCVHALLESGTRIDLFFEAASEVAQQKRPAVRLVVDKADLATRLAPGWEAPTDTIGRIVAVIIRMTRQGGTCRCAYCGEANGRHSR